MRFRDLLAAIIGIAVVGAIGYGMWTWLGDSLGGEEEPPPQPGTDPVATAEFYADAWEQGDHLAMVRYVRDPADDFVGRHTQLEDGLQPQSLGVEVGEIQEPQDGRARFPLTLSLEVAYAEEPLTWDSDLEMIRERGEWGIVWDLQTIHPELREHLEFGTQAEEVERDEIYAADGTVLSGEQTLVTFGFRPDAVSDPDDVEEAFEEAFPGTGERAARELARDDLVDDWFYPLITVSEDRASDARSILGQVSGVLRQTEGGRGLYSDDFALHVVGVVSEATAEQLEERNLPADTRIEIGQLGLERSQETRLLGSDIVRAGLREAGAAEDAPLQVILSETQEDPSGPVETTLDIEVQQAIENTLVGQSGSIGIVAINAEDGAILGAASRPLGGYNRALEGRYAPGSTFKTVTAEALLADGFAPGDDVECPEETSVGGLRIRNAGDRGFGSTDLRTAFAESCNTSFATLAADLGNDALVEAAERFGFNQEYEIGLSHFGGSYPEPGDTAELGASAFGQARVEASVLHMASVAAAAAHGAWHPPYLLQEDGPADPQTLSEGAAESLQDLLRAVVTDGTGSEADVDGLEVLGKTGTAEASGDVEHAWFIGYYDGVGFAILVEEGGSGGEVAAPLASRFVRELSSLRAGGQPSDEDTDDDVEEAPEDLEEGEVEDDDEG